MDIEQFSECCLAKICRTPEHKYLLTVCCVLRGANGEKVVHKKTVPLDNLIEMAKAKIAEFHSTLHNPQVSGVGQKDWDVLLDKAVHAARRMGEARLIRALFEELSPMLGDGSLDDEESDAIQKLHHVVAGAMEGDTNSLQILASLINAAYHGNERALELSVLARKMHLAMLGKEAIQYLESNGTNISGMSTPELLEIGSWWKKFKKIGKVAATIAMPGAPVLWAAKYAMGKRKGKKGSKRGGGVQPSAQETPGMSETTEGQEGGQDFSPASEEQPSGPSDDSPPDSEVSGWLYNKGYRSTAQAVTSRFPGLGLAIREMYHRGVDTPRALAVTETSATPEPQISGTYIVGFSWKKLMRKAQSIAKTASSIANNPLVKQLGPIVASAVPGGGMAFQAAMKAHDMLVKAKANNPEAVQAIATIRNLAEGGNDKALEVAKVMKDMSDKIDQKLKMAMSTIPSSTPVIAPQPAYVIPQPAYMTQPAYPTSAPNFTYSRPTVRDHRRGGYYRAGLSNNWLNKHLRHQGVVTAGWIYNKPYRSVLEAPGAGLAARELYNRGLGHEPTKITDVIKEIFPSLK